MPITGPTSFVPVTEEFLGHWLAVDTALGAGNAVVLPGGVTGGVLQDKLDALVAKQANLQAKINAEEVARGDVEIRRQGLLLRANQFNDKIRALFPGSKWVRALPSVPTITDAQSKFVQPMDDIGNLWGLINADPATPAAVSRLGGYLVAGFLADATGLKNASTTLNVARSNTKIALEERNDLQDEIYEILKSYRQLMPTFFAATHALVESLPNLTPAPGSTPPAPAGNGSWDVATSQAHLTSTAVNDANVTEIEWRYCLGPSYSTDLEAVVPGGSFPGNGATELFTAIGLTAPGAVVSFKPYSKTATGNEKGGNAVTVIHPIGPTPP